MLAEEDYAEALRLYVECARDVKQFRGRWQVPLEGASIRERFLPLRKWYEELTGVADCHENAIMHHRLSNFGRPCRMCGKPLRSPRAKFCAACGTTA